MDREKAIALLKILKTAYPRFYADMTKDEAENTINLWVDMFKHDDTSLVMLATKELINDFKYPPTIADVKEKMYKMTDQSQDSMELWNELAGAVRNCLYKEAEVFNRLSPIVQRFVGSPAQLREMAMTESKTFHTVTKGQFLKQIEVLKQREKDEKMMLPETKKFIAQISSGMDANKLLN